METTRLPSSRQKYPAGYRYPSRARVSKTLCPQSILTASPAGVSVEPLVEIVLHLVLECNGIRYIYPSTGIGAPRKVSILMAFGLPGQYRLDGLIYASQKQTYNV